MSRTIAIAAAALLAAPALAQDVPARAENATAAPGQPGFPERTATFMSVEGTPLGKATIAPLPHGVLFTLDLQGLPPESWLGFHIHETGECDTGTGFKSAGGHFSIAETEHGLMVEAGPIRATCRTSMSAPTASYARRSSTPSSSSAARMPRI